MTTNAYGNQGMTLDSYLAQLGNSDIKNAIGCYFSSPFNPKYLPYQLDYQKWAATLPVADKQQPSAPSGAVQRTGGGSRALAGLMGSGSAGSGSAGSGTVGQPIYWNGLLQSELTGIRAELAHYQAKYGILLPGQESSVNPLGLESEDQVLTALIPRANITINGGSDLPPQYAYPPYAADLSLAAQLYLWNVPIIFDFYDAVRFYCYSTGATGPVSGNVGVKVLYSADCAYRLASRLLQIYTEAGSTLGIKTVRSSRSVPGGGGMSTVALRLSPFMISPIDNAATSFSALGGFQMPNVAGSSGGSADAALGVGPFSPFCWNNRALSQQGCKGIPWTTSLLHFVVAAVALVGVAYAIGAVANEGIATATSGTASGTASGAASGAASGGISTGTSQAIAQGLAAQDAATQATTSTLLSQLGTLSTSQLSALSAASTASEISNLTNAAQSAISTLVSQGVSSGSGSLVSMLKNAVTGSGSASTLTEAGKAVVGLAGAALALKAQQTNQQALLAKAANTAISPQMSTSSTSFLPWVILGGAGILAYMVL